MVDKLTVLQRSANMAKIRGQNTRLEVCLRKLLYKKGVRYRLNYQLPGRPDIVIPTKMTAIFVNGCFWHQHKGCRLAYMPKSNTDFWREKLEGNVVRDKKVHLQLQSMGWKVIAVWECQIEGDFSQLLESITANINCS